MSTPAPSTPPHQFLNCEMEFECPRNWFELTETDKAGIKHCSTCDKPVHLCITQDELDAFARQGECIAFFSDPDLSTRFKLSRERAETNRRDPDFRLERITLGLPRSANRGKLKSFLDSLDEAGNDLSKKN
ncbi:hypothetical protein RAE21_13810 [Rhodoferax sp. TBRC 17198]|uniref:hypothetical protein n=1 Tax=Rhodoferax potami TaxID=3068338 RepID=UPI0028BE4B5C|nr:hypothetical protein [Rhodoferax sp. TBRC 17198]MDT7523467.1 hypothetical protein [Rhodoferax sp. TBRC 17198]